MGETNSNLHLSVPLVGDRGTRWNVCLSSYLIIHARRIVQNRLNELPLTRQWTWEIKGVGEVTWKFMKTIFVWRAECSAYEAFTELSDKWASLARVETWMVPSNSHFLSRCFVILNSTIALFSTWTKTSRLCCWMRWMGLLTILTQFPQESLRFILGLQWFRVEKLWGFFCYTARRSEKLRMYLQVISSTFDLFSDCIILLSRFKVTRPASDQFDELFYNHPNTV